MNVLVSMILLFLVIFLISIFYFYKKYNKYTRIEKNTILVRDIYVNGAKRDLEDVRNSLKSLKEQTNNI